MNRDYGFCVLHADVEQIFASLKPLNTGHSWFLSFEVTAIFVTFEKPRMKLFEACRSGENGKT